MSMGHEHQPQNYNRAFMIGVGLNTAFIVIEFACGILADSLALIADAGHNLSDVFSLLLAWGANLLAARKPTLRRTYGFRRATILAALFSAILLVIALGAIAWEAVERFSRPPLVQGEIIMWVAGIGVVINTATALLFLSGRDKDLNIRGAFLHMAADAAVSLTIVIAGLAIMLTGWLWLDPSISLVVAVIILFATMDLLRDSANLAIDAVPKGIEPDAVKAYLLSLNGVADVHDFHIWGMSTSQAALTVHLIMPEPPQNDIFLQELASQLRGQFGIEHSTIQIERGDSKRQCATVQSHCV